MNPAEARRLVQWGLAQGLMRYPGLRNEPPAVETYVNSDEIRAAKLGLSLEEFRRQKRARKAQLREGATRRTTGWKQANRARWGQRKVEKLAAEKVA